MWITALLAFVLDQLSKYVVIHLLGVSALKSIEVAPPILRVVYGENRGINFGLGDGISVWVLIIIALAICAAVIFWLSRHTQPALARASAGLLVGGALANVLDRVLYGYCARFF